MPGRYSTITLVGPRTTRDLALPGDIPVAQLLPQILRPELLAEAEDPAAPAVWMLTTMDGRRLPGDATLHQCGLGDGEILHLHDAADPPVAVFVDDTRDAIEDLTDERRPDPATGRTIAAASATAVVAAAAFLPGGAIAVAVTAALAAALAVLVAWWAARDLPVLSHVALVAGVLWGLRFGYQVSEGFAAAGAAQPIRVACGLLVATLVTAVALIGTPLALSYVSALAGATALGGAAAVALALGAAPVPVAAVAAITGLFLVGVLPQAAMTVGSLTGWDRRVQAGEELPTERLRWRLEHVDAVLLGGLVAVGGTVTTAAVVLSLAGGYPALLGTGVALALLTRSRIFDRIGQLVPLRAGSAVALAVAGWQWASAAPVSAQWLPAIALLAGLGCAAVALLEPSPLGRARIRRITGIAELVLVAVLIALAGQVVGLYHWVATLAA